MYAMVDNGGNGWYLCVLAKMVENGGQWWVNGGSWWVQSVTVRMVGTACVALSD